MNGYVYAIMYLLAGLVLCGIGFLFHNGFIILGGILILIAIRIMKFIDTYRIVSDRKKKTKR